jgi:hypothetical protein
VTTTRCGSPVSTLEGPSPRREFWECVHYQSGLMTPVRSTAALARSVIVPRETRVGVPPLSAALRQSAY